MSSFGVKLMDNRSRAQRTVTVTPADTAARFGEQFPEAAATPFVLGISEVTCHDVLAPQLADGEITVGLSAEVRHVAPTPVGATLTAYATLVERRGNKASFEVEVHDEAGVCATLTHRRAVVQRADIEARLRAHEGGNRA